MRKIKFRYWVKSEKDMGFWPGNGVLNAKFFEEILKDKDWVIMQYTGLDDKNGKGIYEGDIVFVMALKRNLKVIYREEVCAFELFEDVDYRINYFTLDNSEMKIIGNVYENPELWEDK